MLGFRHMDVRCVCVCVSVCICGFALGDDNNVFQASF